MHYVLLLQYKTAPTDALCYILKILGAFEKLLKAIISFVMSVRPSALKISAPIGRIFITFYILIFFDNMSRKFKFH
jgi:hypothetical protein